LVIGLSVTDDRPGGGVPAEGQLQSPPPEKGAGDWGD